MVIISRQSRFYTIVTAALGVIGAVLRVIELNTVFEPETGLALRGQPITILLALFSAASIVLFIILSGKLRKLAAPRTYCLALKSRNSFALVISALAAFGLAIGSVLYYIARPGEVTAMLLILLGFLAALSAFMLAYNVYFGKESPGNAAFSTIVVIFVCLWMVLEYKMRAADPVVLRYVYDFLALCGAAVAFYYKAGFAFDRPRPARTVLYSMIACYFCLVAMPGASGNAQLIFFFCLALLLFADLPAIIGNLREKDEGEEQEASEEEEEPDGQEEQEEEDEEQDDESSL